MEHFCEITLKSGHWPRRRGCLKIVSLLSSGDCFVQQCGNILAMLRHKRNISVKLFSNQAKGKGGDVI